MNTVLFILGAGASADSGIPTYRGSNGVYTNEFTSDNLSIYTPLDKVWDFLAPLYEKIKESTSGPTYHLLSLLQEKCKDSLILTQNIDGHALSTGMNIVEMHGSHKTMSCITCKQTVNTDLNIRSCSNCCGFYRPDIVLYGEDLCKRKTWQVYCFLKKRPSHIVVIGTNTTISLFT